MALSYGARLGWHGNRGGDLKRLFRSRPMLTADDVWRLTDGGAVSVTVWIVDAVTSIVDVLVIEAIEVAVTKSVEVASVI